MCTSNEFYKCWRFITTDWRRVWWTMGSVQKATIVHRKFFKCWLEVTDEASAIRIDKSIKPLSMQNTCGCSNLEMLIQLRVAPAVRCKGHPGGVLNDGPTCNVHIEGGVSGGVYSQLLTGNHKHTVSAVIHKHRARHWTTQYPSHRGQSSEQ